MFNVPLFLAVPLGKVPTKTTSWTAYLVAEPLPVFHSLKPIVLLSSQRRSMSLIRVTLALRADIMGNGAVRRPAGPRWAANSRLEPTEAK